MTRIDLHPEELFDRAHSGLASKDDQLRLKAHLDGCPACRFEHALGVDCRQSAAPQTGDELVIGRIKASVVRALERRSRTGSPGSATRRPRRWILLACAAILLGGTVGAATAFWRARSVPVEHSKEGPARGVAQRPGSGTEEATTTPPAPSVSDTGSAETTNQVVEPASSIRRAPRPPTDDAPKASSAAELFARANSLRRQNEPAEAMRVYRELQRAYPGSPEELVSRITLGRLLLDRLGNAGAALAEFDGYLARAPGGSLSEEAMIGRALALGRLGRSAEERGAWAALLAAHPASTYAARARERIAQTTVK